jgi:antitoxin HigA-1
VLKKMSMSKVRGTNPSADQIAEMATRGEDVSPYFTNQFDVRGSERMKNPPHPGFSIREACLERSGLSVTDGAKFLGIARQTLSRVLNGQGAISPEMAIRLEKAGWSKADHWVRMQAAYDLAQARRFEDEIRVSLSTRQREAQRSKTLL